MLRLRSHDLDCGNIICCAISYKNEKSSNLSVLSLFISLFTLIVMLVIKFAKCLILLQFYRGEREPCTL